MNQYPVKELRDEDLKPEWQAFKGLVETCDKRIALIDQEKQEYLTCMNNVFIEMIDRGLV